MGIPRSRSEGLTFILNYDLLIVLQSWDNMMLVEARCGKQVRMLSKTEGAEGDLEGHGEVAVMKERKGKEEDEEEKERKEEREMLKKSLRTPSN